MNTYLITYQIEGSEHIHSDEIEAHDEACALGCVLDGLEDDEDGDPPALAFVTIQRPEAVLPLAAMPSAVMQAWRDGLEVAS